ncbi:MAG: protein kinase [Gemmatimonadaceae bacterium]
MSLGRSFEVTIASDSASIEKLRAIKRVVPDASEREALEARLLAEGAMLQELDGGAGILRCYEIHRDPASLVLEFVTGGSLATRLTPSYEDLSDTMLERSAALTSFRAVAAAAAHAHAHGIIHRDIKPSNILFTATNEIRLSDLGIAVRRGARSTAEGWEDLHAGTLGYAAPELLRDPARANTESVDSYGLGALLHELLLGAPPHMMRGTETESELRARIIAGAHRDLTARENELSPALRQLIDSALAADSSMRPQSVAKLLELLDAAVASAP